MITWIGTEMENAIVFGRNHLYGPRLRSEKDCENDLNALLFFTWLHILQLSRRLEDVSNSHRYSEAIDCVNGTGLTKKFLYTSLTHCPFHPHLRSVSSDSERYCSCVLAIAQLALVFNGSTL